MKNIFGWAATGWIGLSLVALIGLGADPLLTKTVTETVIEYSRATNPDDKARAATKLEEPFKQMMQIIDDSPEITKPVKDFLVEPVKQNTTKLAPIKETYNKAVEEYNKTLDTTAGKLVGGVLGHTKIPRL